MNQLRIARENAGFGFVKAATELGIGVATLWRYENGKQKRYDSAVLSKMATLYGVSLNQLQEQKTA